MFAKQSERKNMLIYNTTYQVEEGQEDNFLIWIKEFYLPEVERVRDAPQLYFVYSVTVQRAEPVIPFHFEVENSGVSIAGIWKGTKLGRKNLVKIFQDKVVGFPTLYGVSRVIQPVKENILGLSKYSFSQRLYRSI